MLLIGATPILVIKVWMHEVPAVSQQFGADCIKFDKRISCTQHRAN